MKIHILSRSSWFESHRIRQQLASLLSEKYSVEYHSPISNDRGQDRVDSVALGHFPFIEKMGSVPLVCGVNAWRLSCYLKKVVTPGDVIFNFLPELSISKIPANVRTFFVINDDFAAMAPRISAWWVRYMMARAAHISSATIYLSTNYMRSYPSNQQILFYPWADRKNLRRSKTRNIILYWGYISPLLDFSVIEKIAAQIEDEELGLQILFVGPLNPLVQSKLREIEVRYKCFEVRSATDLASLSPEEVLFGIEILDGRHKNSLTVEVPNKAPRLLAYGIPLVFTNCPLLDEPFFIEYKNNLRQIIERVIRDEDQLTTAISSYLDLNNSRTRLEVLSRLVDGEKK